MNNNARATQPNIDAAPTLPQDRTIMLNTLIRLTQNLSNLADREAQALAQNDMLTFAILQDEKTLVAEQYASTSEEFRTNINFYRGVDANLLDRLDALQKDLGEKTRSNNDVVTQIYNRAQDRTQNSLLAAQELGQDQRIRFEQAQDNTDEHSTSAKKAGA